MKFFARSWPTTPRGPLPVLQMVCTVLAGFFLVLGSVLISIIWLGKSHFVVQVC